MSVVTYSLVWSVCTVVCAGYGLGHSVAARQSHLAQETFVDKRHLTTVFQVKLESKSDSATLRQRRLQPGDAACDFCGACWVRRRRDKLPKIKRCCRSKVSLVRRGGRRMMMMMMMMRARCHNEIGNVFPLFPSLSIYLTLSDSNHNYHYVAAHSKML